MGTILGSWSGMRKYLEQEMLAQSMKGRIRYNCTSYVGMDGDRIFELFLDDKLFKQFSLETVQSYFHRTGLVQHYDTKFSSADEYWNDFWETLEKTPMNERTEYTDAEFCSALESYRNNDIAISLASDDPIQKMFAVLDRRVGKRTIIKLKDEMSKLPGCFFKLYCIRCEAESVKF